MTTLTIEEAIENLEYQNEKFFGGQSESLKMAISALKKTKCSCFIKKKDNTMGWRWTNLEDNDYECSWCHRRSNEPYNFCPDCGADMRGE